MRKLITLVAALFISQAAYADVAVIGFNADGTDGFTLLATNDIASGTTYWLRDEEWNGTEFASPTGEGIVSFSIDENVIAGTIMNFNNIDDDPTVPSISDGFGTTIASTFGGDVTTGLSSGGEGIYFFQDNSTMDGSTVDVQIASFINGTNAGTSFSSGNNVNFAGSSLDEVDVSAYTGQTSGLLAINDYVALIQDVNNWTAQGDGSGDQSGSYAPATGMFTAVPEPSSTAAVIGIVVLAVARRRK